VGDRGSISESGRDFSLRYCIQTGSGPHPASYRMGAGGSFPGVRRPGREADHSPPCSAEVKNAWSYTFTPPYVFMAWNFVKQRDNFASLQFRSYDLKFSRRLNSMKSRTLSRCRCLYETDVSRAISVLIGIMQTPDTADSPRRFHPAIQDDWSPVEAIV
jgi:hypothetical protein